MTKETLFTDLTDASNSLLQLARALSFNTISDNSLYIISEIPKEIIDLRAERRISNRNNRNKKPVELNDAIADLEILYPILYDINLFIYKSKKNLTIIDIRYFSRSSLDLEYRKLVENKPPMLHSKVTYPPYHKDGEKLDINWETGNLRYHWNMFKLYFKVRRMETERNKRLNLYYFLQQISAKRGSTFLDVIVFKRAYGMK